MAAHCELVADAMLEDQIADIWPDYPCLYDVRSTAIKNRDFRKQALQELAEKLGQPGKLCRNYFKVWIVHMYHCKRVIHR